MIAFKAKKQMKTLLKLLAVTSTMAALAFNVAAADKTLTGKGECAKCSLKQTSSCQMAITVKEDGKDKTYLLANNDVAKAFHKNICQEEKQVTVTGAVKEDGGKQVIEAKKIEVAKK